jgi:hypothetical protein
VAEQSKEISHSQSLSDRILIHCDPIH